MMKSHHHRVILNHACLLLLLGHVQHAPLLSMLREKCIVGRAGIILLAPIILHLGFSLATSNISHQVDVSFLA